MRRKNQWDEFWKFDTERKDVCIVDRLSFVTAMARGKRKGWELVYLNAIDKTNALITNESIILIKITLNFA